MYFFCFVTKANDFRICLLIRLFFLFLEKHSYFVPKAYTFNRNLYNLLFLLILKLSGHIILKDFIAVYFPIKWVHIWRLIVILLKWWYVGWIQVRIYQSVLLNFINLFDQCLLNLSNIPWHYQSIDRILNLQYHISEIDCPYSLHFPYYHLLLIFIFLPSNIYNLINISHTRIIGSYLHWSILHGLCYH